MNSKPTHQKIINYIAYTFIGLIGLGTLLDSISNAISLVDSKIATTGTVFIIIFLLFVQLYLKKFPLSWIYSNQKILIKGLGIRPILASLGAIILLWIPILSNSLEKTNKNASKASVCDRDLDTGCQIDLPDILNWKLSINGLGGALQYTVSVGKNQTVGKLQFIDNPVDMNLPKYMQFPKDDSPYQISCDENHLFFSGDVREFKNNELIGWFDQNDFGSYDCKMLWNKDECGLEILDKYGYVVFSVDYIASTEKIEFKGYYKKDDFIYIFNNGYYRRDDIKSAEKLISQIKPIFKHRGKNSTGVRLIAKSCN